MLPKLKQETPALKNIFSQSLQQVMKRVNDGYYLFFKKAVIHPPKFRSCKRFYNICYPQPKVGYKIEDNKVIAKLYDVKRNKTKDVLHKIEELLLHIRQ